MKASIGFVAVLVLIGGWTVGVHLNDPSTHGGAVWSMAFAANDGTSKPESRWVVDPREPGPMLPETGRSLFDLVATSSGPNGTQYDVPFPFEALVARIEKVAGCAPPDASCTRQVLIPLGRSLQRTAASPDFFAYPRVVVAVDREGGAKRAATLLKDRLYLGYQEKSNLIEVISYNETAGRFEFQLVKDYRKGGTPRVVYANRTVCIACHQNHAPLFSRQQWDETNANPRVAALLTALQPTFYGTPARRGVEVPNAIDDAIHRANTLSVGNLLWREGCGGGDAEGVRCRAAALLAAWQYRLSGERGFDVSNHEFRERVVDVLGRNAATRWPGGLAIPNPEIPNRDPFSFFLGATGLAMTNVRAALEPLVPRAPLATWSPDDPTLARRFVMALAERITDADARAIDARLATEKTGPRERFVSQCDLRRMEGELRFQCHPGEGESGAVVNGKVAVRAERVESGEVASLALAGGEPLQHLSIGGGNVKRRGGDGTLSFMPMSRELRARLLDGRAIESVSIDWKANGRGSATVMVIDDLGPLREAVAAMGTHREGNGSLAPRVFDRADVMAALFSRLGVASSTAAERELPPVEADVDTSPEVDQLAVAAVFKQHCTPCHQTPERAPPNFLHGDAKRVDAALNACAPRIFVRVSMWQLAAGARDKTPMPPAFAVHASGAGRGRMEPDPALIASLRGTAGEMLRAETGRVPTVDELLARGYENLRPCVPADL